MCFLFCTMCLFCFHLYYFCTFCIPTSQLQFSQCNLIVCIALFMKIILCILIFHFYFISLLFYYVGKGSSSSNNNSSNNLRNQDRTNLRLRREYKINNSDGQNEVEEGSDSDSLGNTYDGNNNKKENINNHNSHQNNHENGKENEKENSYNLNLDGTNINTNVRKVEECTNHDGKRCTITCFSPDGSPLQGTYVQYLHLCFNF